jgi:cadmium resistance protein CadD (predicted permease)
MVAVVPAAALLFAGTNVDDMVVLGLLNVSRRTGGRPAAWQIWVGQYTGVAILVVVSLLGAWGLRLVPYRWVWLLGLVPLGLGLCRLIGAVRARGLSTERAPVVPGGLTAVIGLTIANGADNLAAYVPAFRAIDGAALAVTLAVFAVGVAVWCAIGSWLVPHPRVTAAADRWGHWIVPAVFIALGGYLIAKVLA